MQQEPLLRQNINRFTLFPLKYPTIYKAFEDAQNSYWTSGEIDYSADTKDWNKLNKGEQYFIKNILAFFAGSDGIVMENLMDNFCSEVTIPEARCFYTFQAAIESVHSQVYSLLIETFIKDLDDPTDMVKEILQYQGIRTNKELRDEYKNRKDSS